MNVRPVHPWPISAESSDASGELSEESSSRFAFSLFPFSLPLFPLLCLPFSGSHDVFSIPIKITAAQTPAQRPEPLVAQPSILEKSLDEWISKYSHQRGMKPFYAYYLRDQAIKFFRDFIDELEDASPEAHERRRTTTADVGISLPKLLLRLQGKNPFMRQYFPFQSPSTLAHLFPPPNLRRRTASLYRSLIDARPARGENDFHDDHPLVRLLFPPLFFSSYFYYKLLFIIIFI